MVIELPVAAGNFGDLLEAQVVRIRSVERKDNVNETFPQLGNVGYAFAGCGDSNHRFRGMHSYIPDPLVFAYEVIEQLARMLRLAPEEVSERSFC